MSVSLGVKGIILHVETGIKDQQQPQDEDMCGAFSGAAEKSKDGGISFLYIHFKPQP